MKTVLIYDDTYPRLKFAVVDGDYRHLNRVYINGRHDRAALDALSDLLFDMETREEKLDFLYEFPVDAVRNGAEVIVCGLRP